MKTSREGMMGALQCRQLSTEGWEVWDRGRRMGLRRSGGGRFFDSGNGSKKGRRFGEIKGEEGEVDTFLEVIVCSGDE